MGLGIFNKEKSFKSNDKMFELIFGTKNVMEDELELRNLYRNIESINLGNESVLIKYKDLKVRSPLEVKKIRENLRKEAGLEL